VVQRQGEKQAADRGSGVDLDVDGKVSDEAVASAGQNIEIDGLGAPTVAVMRDTVCYDHSSRKNFICKGIYGT
jgi:hypothetical protein